MVDKKMRYLKYFESEVVEISIEEKVQSIIDMYIYLCDHRDIEDGGNFIGECSVLFMECGIRDRTKRGDRRVFNTDLNVIVNSLEKSKYGSDRKLETIDKLYPFAKEIHGSRTIEDIEKLIMPFIEKSTTIDGHIYKKDWFWRSFDKKQAWMFDFRLDPELYEIDEKDVIGKGHPGNTHWTDEEKVPGMKRALKMFYQYRKIIKNELKRVRFKSNGLRYELHDSSHFNDIYKVSLLILPL